MRAIVSIVNDGQLIYGGAVDSVVANCKAKMTHVLFTENDICLVRLTGDAVKPVQVESKIDDNKYVQVILNDLNVVSATKGA